jgi:ferredoxin
MPKLSKVRAALGFVLARSRTVLSLTLPIFSSTSPPFLVRGQVSVKAVRPNVTLVTRGSAQATQIAGIRSWLFAVTKVISLVLRCGHDCVASSEVRGAKVEETVKKEVTYKWLPVIVEDACTGCGLCVAACGPACLETRKLVAILTRPEDCGSEEHCIRACPEDAIHMAWLPSEGDPSLGTWRSAEQIQAGLCSAPEVISA